MTGLHSFQAALSTFGDSIGTPGLALDEVGLCSIEVRDVGTVTFLAREDADPVMFASLRRLDPSGGEALLRLMLEGNLLWRATHGATFALDAESGSVILQQPIRPADLGTASLFRSAVERFVAQVAAWSETLATRANQAPRRAERAADDVLPAFSIRV